MNIRSLAFITSACLCTGITQAATAVFDDFEAGLGSWVGNTTQTNVANLGAGNPGNHLHTDNIGNPTSFRAIGATNTGANYSGVFADGLWEVSVDLIFHRGDFDDARLRFRFQDSTANGWYISLTNTFDASWNTFSVMFDTTWDDVTAMNNGWVKEVDGMSTATPSFAGLWDNVYTSEVRLVGAATSTTLAAGIDNYRASVVPVPAAVWLFGSGLLGLIGIARKKA